jgi:spoIIIJ-associated protein
MLRKYHANSLQEVLELAADEENIDIPYLNYVVLKEEEGFVEIGCAFIADIIAFIKNWLLSLFAKLEVEANLDVTYKDEVIKVAIESPRSSTLIGKQGFTLTSLTKVIRAGVTHNFKKHYSILLDINDYKDARYRKILSYAKHIASEVQKTRTSVRLFPMTSDERRVIHNALTNYHHIRTESYGEGQRRAIIIKYDATKIQN